MCVEPTYVTFIHFRERMAPRFEIDDTLRRQYKRYNAVGTQFTVRLLPPRKIVIL